MIAISATKILAPAGFEHRRRLHRAAATCFDREHPDGWLDYAMSDCANSETRTQPALPLRQRPKIQALLRLDRRIGTLA
jgi:hypothetical protein